MDREIIRVLLVEDQTDDAHLVIRALQHFSTPRYEVEHVGSLSRATSVALEGNFDAILLRIATPESTRMETIRSFRKVCSVDLPIVILANRDDYKCALEMLAEGIQDYIVKDDLTPSSLSRSILYSIRRHSMWKEIAQANRELENKNEHLSKLYEMAQQFVDNVSHEFRTPLTVIREFTSIVKDGLDGPVTSKQAHHLEKVIQRTDDLALMVDDMLDISKLEAGLLSVWRRPCCATELVRGIRSLLEGRADAKNIQLDFEVSPCLPLLYCDEEKAGRVIINLTVNALKFTPEGGKVTIWAKPDQSNHGVVIGVSDSGPGIREEDLEEIFERFQQIESNIRSSTKGFGLGLNIAKELVALNLGKMNVESVVGEGSTFSFTLPAYDTSLLLKKYVGRVEKSINRNDVSLSLFSVRILTDALEMDPVVDEFLQRVVRGQDLVLSSGELTWVILAHCSKQETAGFINRIEQEWQDFVRNCPNSDLPEISLQQRGIWSLPEERNLLLQASESALSGEQYAELRKVLVVDDNPEVNQCLGLRLQSAGYEVRSASNGEEGLQTLGEFDADAIVLDVRMPKMDGMEMLHHLRAKEATKNTPVVMLSASVRDQHKALDSGANFFVAKPYMANHVLSAIETSMNRENTICPTT